MRMLRGGGFTFAVDFFANTAYPRVLDRSVSTVDCSDVSNLMLGLTPQSSAFLRLSNLELHILGFRGITYR